MEEKRGRRRRGENEGEASLAEVLPIEERIVAMLCHLLALVTLFFAPLVIFLLNRDRSKFVMFHALQATFLEIVFFLVTTVICVPLTWIFVGYIVLPLLMIGNIVYLIYVGLKALEGEWTEYVLVGPWARALVEK